MDTLRIQIGGREGAQFLEQVARRLVALRGVLGDTPIDRPPQRGRNLRSIGGGSSPRIADIVCTDSGFSNAFRPVAISYSTSPRGELVGAVIAGLPRACSGLM